MSGNPPDLCGIITLLTSGTHRPTISISVQRIGIQRRGFSVMSFLILVFTLLSASQAAPQPQSPAGAAVFESKCASCHVTVEGRTPSVAALRQRTPAAILEAL